MLHRVLLVDILDTSFSYQDRYIASLIQSEFC